MLRIILTLFVWGILFGSGPCLASCGPILISYAAGTKKDTFKSFLMYALFSVSRITVYVVLSLFIYFLGKFTVDKFLGGISKYLFIGGGIFIILIGLLMILGKRWEYPLCSFLGKRILEQDKKSIVALGLIIGLLPCGPLLAVLSYIGLVSKSWMGSLLYGAAFGAGTFLSPLLLVTITTGFIAKLLKNRNLVFGRLIGIVCGLIIILLGAQLIYRGLKNV